MYGWTPLHYAAESGHLDVCKLIIANVDDKNPINIFGETPKYAAKLNNHVEVVELF